MPRWHEKRDHPTLIIFLLPVGIKESPTPCVVSFAVLGVRPSRHMADFRVERLSLKDLDSPALSYTAVVVVNGKLRARGSRVCGPRGAEIRRSLRKWAPYFPG